MSEMPVRYLKFNFRTQNSDYKAGCALSRLKLYDELGNHITEGLLPEIELESNSHFGSDRDAITDDNLERAYGWYWKSSAARYSNADFVYDLGEPKSADYFEVALSKVEGLPSDRDFTGASNITLRLYSSTDKVNWTLRYVQAKVCPEYGVSYRRPLSSSSKLWPSPRRGLLSGSGGIYGIVSEDGIARPNRPVYLYERDTFSRIGYEITDENGGYAFNGLNKDREYMVMSVDPTGPPFRNAIVWDRIKPINTKGNLAPQSAFWARRARDPDLGAVVAVTDYVDATAFDYMNGGQLGGVPIQHLDNNYPGMEFDAIDSVGGSLKFLMSNRSPETRGRGLFARPGACIFSVKAEHNQPENYSALTFEYILKSPAPNEEPLIITWTGIANGASSELVDGGGSNNHRGFGSGPTIEVTDQVINIRFPLSGRNRSTPKSTYPIVPGKVYHIAVAYLQDETIDCYINGELSGSASIPAAGRLWGHAMVDDYKTAAAFDDWDEAYSTISSRNGPISWFSTLHVGGSGRGLNGGGTKNRIPPGHGGSFAMSALYGRHMTASEIADLYDSFVNWETHGVPSTQSGYAGEVEADTPAMYYRMNELSVDDIPISLIGHKGLLGKWEGRPGFNAEGFSAGNPAVDTSSGSLLLDEAKVINSVFTIELMIRQADQSGQQYPFMARQYESSALVYLKVEDGLLTLKVTDASGTTVPVDNAQPLDQGKDYHVVVTYDPWYERESKVYLNGELKGVAGTPLFPDVYSLARWLCVGANASSSGPNIGGRFKGVIGEFAFYNYVLPPERVASHYAALDS